MTNINDGDLITLENGDLVEVSFKVVKKKEIVPIAGSTYKLKHTGAFCHWYGNPHFRTDIDDLSNYTFQYIGRVDAPAGVRAIFYCNEETSYVMFSTNNFNYITEELLIKQITS